MPGSLLFGGRAAPAWLVGLVAQGSGVEQGQAVSDARMWGGGCAQAAPGARLAPGVLEVGRDLAASCPGTEPPSSASSWEVVFGPFSPQVSHGS